MDTRFGKIQATADADEDTLSRTCATADDTEGGPPAEDTEGQIPRRFAVKRNREAETRGAWGA